MRQFIKRALKKLDKLTPSQMQDIFLSATEEIGRIEAVLDSVSAGLLVCDTSHNLILANKAALRLLPINSYEQESEPVWNLIGEENAAAFLKATLSSGDKAEEWELDVEVNGKPRLLSLSVRPLVQKRSGRRVEVSGSLIQIVDITERRSKEVRMRRMESLASLTTLAAGVAHEIKNPLGSLSIHIQLVQKALGSCRLLCDQNSTEGDKKPEPKAHLKDIDRYLSVIDEEIERLNQIVVDFLFAVKPMDLDLRLGNINSLLEELAGFVSYELNEANIECILELTENLPFVNFDASFMKQAFLNLIKNSLVAMPGGGKLTIRTSAQDDSIRISVADTGIGISDENLTKIFEPYFTTRPAGTGLGLTLVFKIVREHHGEIIVNSTQGEGSVFTITLPIPQTETRLIGAP
ncbi:MAG: PAS domain-containing protein [Treponema sp.]|jgi:signal transduction histidine kinase|nr:PAS domain-containing protein [Treponema sp.]